MIVNKILLVVRGMAYFNIPLCCLGTFGISKWLWCFNFLPWFPFFWRGNHAPYIILNVTSRTLFLTSTAVLSANPKILIRKDFQHFESWLRDKYYFKRRVNTFSYMQTMDFENQYIGVFLVIFFTLKGNKTMLLS